jgi:hypothetical protein
MLDLVHDALDDLGGLVGLVLLEDLRERARALIGQKRHWLRVVCDGSGAVLGDLSLTVIQFFSMGFALLPPVSTQTGLYRQVLTRRLK